ncbi:laminin subunit alpha-1 [Stigmatopora nigra]
MKWHWERGTHSSSEAARRAFQRHRLGPLFAMKWLLLIWISLSPWAAGRAAGRAASRQRGLFPAILNLASKADISSNATCGEPEGEVYCKLVEHVPGRPIKNPHCPKCDANSILSKERHPIGNAIDGTNRWWQSPSIKNGRRFHWVTVTLDLKQVFQVAYVIIKAANSPRPGNWILERSVDGVSFQPWQFYAISDSECLSRYNVTPRLGAPTYKGDTEVICTSYYSRLEPLEHGEIHTSLINSRPGAEDLTSELLNFTSARFIRLRLQRIRTLNADLMTLSARDPREVDPIVTRRYYYSIKDISVGGMCICYGHARSCPPDPVSQKLQCVCEHNTCGSSCQHCCPGYHQLPWQPGTVSEGNTCEECNCHGKAHRCSYNQTVADLGLSLDIRGLRRGGGVCAHCRRNTAGINCQTCAGGFYRPRGVSPHAEWPCVECRCHPRGARSPVCVGDDASAAESGQCACREGFAGRRCDRCAFGFRDFPLCERCECRLAGSLGQDPCRDCVCKANVMGVRCDLCKGGFYNLRAADPLGCTHCFCFGVSDVCESSTWSTAQVVSSDLPSDGAWWEAGEAFLGNKLASYGGLLNYSLAYRGRRDDRPIAVRTDVRLQGDGRTLRLSALRAVLLSPSERRSVAVEVLPRHFVREGRSAAVSRHDLMSVLAEVTSLRVEVHVDASAGGAVSLVGASLDVAVPGAAPGVRALAVETCQCPWGYGGTSCESCLPGFYRLGGVLFGGNCVRCECNDHASECDANGTCLDCGHGTGGAHCERCLPGFYGDATQGTEDDCRRCACPLTEPSNNFSPTCTLDSSGVARCDRCREGYAGSKCHKCAAGFYGDPQVSGGSCVRCQCNGNVDGRDEGRCDGQSGECLRCLGNTAGSHCQICAPGFYGDAVRRKNCRDCQCDVNGSRSDVCDETSGQCVCRDNVTGRACDRCQVGSGTFFFSLLTRSQVHQTPTGVGLQSGFFGLRSASGCRACRCDPPGSLGETCDHRGRCTCAEGVGGDKCDRCGHGYFGLRVDECAACDCNRTGGNCHHRTGECICPAHTEGDTCEACQAGYWDHHPVAGCKPCDCDAEGSSASRCDPTDGSCPCKEGFSGRRCERCAPGRYGYPACPPCGCDVAGTREEWCNATSGTCDCRPSGECACKAAVSGRRCQECLRGFFALSAHRPEGCSPCYCSGVSRDCEERAGLVGDLIWAERSPVLVPMVGRADEEEVATAGVYRRGGDTLLDTGRLNGSAGGGPLYWRLPPQFEGQQLLSYGGLLSYVVTFYADDATGFANQEPQVLMRGGALRKLLIYTDAPAPDNGVATQHRIRLTEHKWKYFNSVSEKAVSHSDFLSVLAHLQYVMVKASYGTGLRQSGISNITMETAREAHPAEPGGTGAARSIESCFCPPGYAGLSCQECAPGFFRQPLSELSPEAQKSAVVRPCVACRCHNHSAACHAESGRCLDCRDHTDGANCERCAPGHYGNVGGSVGDCLPCACPLRDNSFSPTCVSEGTPGDFRCNSCLPGYEGRYCQRCSAGYYGNSSAPGGKCSPCGCSRWGSLGATCHPLSGLCRCKAGVQGPACDRCHERYVLEEGKCVACDRHCVGALLDDLDAIHRRWRAFNISAVTMAPYRRLVALNQKTGHSKLMLSEGALLQTRVSRVEEESAHLTSDIAALIERVSARVILPGVATRKAFGTFGQAATADGPGELDDSLSLASGLTEKIRAIQDAIQTLGAEAERLDRTGREALRTADRTRLLERMTWALQNMRVRHLDGAAHLARRELGLAESLAESVPRRFPAGVDGAPRPLAMALDAHVQKLREAQKRTGDAAGESAQARLVLRAADGLLDDYRARRWNVSQARACAEGAMEDARRLLDRVLDPTSSSPPADVAQLAGEAEALGGQLEQWRAPLRNKVEALLRALKGGDSSERVYRAESHARQMESHALSLDSHLSPARNASDNGRRSAAPPGLHVARHVERAWRMASDAVRTAGAALNLTGRWEPSAEGGADRISAALDETRAVERTNGDLQLTLSALTGRLRTLSQRALQTSVLLRGNLTAGGPPGRESGSESGSVAGSEAALAQSGVREALERLSALENQLSHSRRALEKTNASVAETERLMTRTHLNADQARRTLEEAELGTRHLSEKIKPMSWLGESLSRNLSHIRELIYQARRQAASIKVAVRADGDCVRSYRPQIQSGNFNTLTLTLKTKSPDNLLFYLGGKTTVDFLALEMNHGKVSFLWDLGSGGARLEYPGLDIANDKWTTINVTRLGARGFLSVHQPETSPSSPPTVTAASPGPARVLHVDNDTAVHVGGLAEGAQRPAALRRWTFRGCLGEASLDEKNVGLWNYVDRRGGCGGCFGSPQAEETSFHFDGSGFSVVQKSLRATSTSVVLLFKTLSPSGLLLYLASNDTRDFLSIELVEGCLRLTFDLGSGPLVLTSLRKYNTGGWYKVTSQRNRRKGYLLINPADQSSDKEMLEAESPGSASDLNRSDLDPIYVGGLPASRPIRRQVTSRSYVGCIKNVEIARLNFDLLRDAHGVRKGCVLEAVRSVSILSAGGGYVQMPGASLEQEAEILFSFTSNKPSGVLLAALTQKPSQRQYFLSVHLLAGSLEAEFGETGEEGRRVAVAAPHGGSWADGSKHSVVLNFNRKSFSLQVDEGKVKWASPTAGGLAALSAASFFIGGLPSGEESHLPLRLQNLSKSFRGCVRHLVLGDRLMDLSAALKYEGAVLDSCRLEEKIPGALLPEEAEATLEPSHLSLAPPTPAASTTPGQLACAREKELSFLPTAVQFGSWPHSHMTFLLEPAAVRKSVSLRLSLRTRARDGLLLLLSDERRADFAVLQLVGGRALVSADLGKGVATAVSSLPLDDGKWHTVSADVARRSVSVSVDASAPDVAAVKGNQLDVSQRLYLGGLPPAYRGPRMNVTTSFPGCVHSVSLNGVTLDLSRPASRRDAASCFSRDESGSYFDGSGYAALMRDGYKVGSDVSVSLEFRTSRSEGVFLGISSAKVDAIGLEMIRGQVVFNVNNGAGRVAVASGGPALCDGRWHRLLARKTKHSLTLSVDGRRHSVPNPYPQSTSAETNNPVYVGGYPDGVKQNCLSAEWPFRGCLKNIRLVKSHLDTHLDVSRAHLSSGVTAGSCPAA